MKNRPRSFETDTPPRRPPTPRAIADVDIATPEPNLWGDDVGGGTIPIPPPEAAPDPDDRD